MSVIKKLKFTEDKVLTVNMPDNCKGLFEDMTVVTKYSGSTKYNQVLLFAQEKKVLEAELKGMVSKLSSTAMFWIAYPKKSGSIESDLSRDDFWNILKSDGYAPVMQIALDKDWSVLRFRKTSDIGTMVRDTPMNDRNIEGIDFEKRTVTLPKDASTAIKRIKGLEKFFYSMSFSHKKEYVQAIVEAKKEETRKGRIDKMIEMVVALREKKEQKK
ncbi:MAG: YdeI/OmpD-associated family protein [Flavipsychrobacter sp.]